MNMKILADGPIEVSTKPENRVGIHFTNKPGLELMEIQLSAHDAVGLAYALADKAGYAFTRAYYLRNNTQPFLLRLKYALLLLVGAPDGSEP